MKRIIKPAVTLVMAILLLWTCVPAAAAGTSSASADFTVSDYKSLVEVIAQQYISRDSKFAIRFNASADEIKHRLRQGGPLWDDVFSVDIPGTTSDLDYLHNNMSVMRLSYLYSSTSAVCEFTQTYLTTAAQENDVDTAVAKALRALDIEDSSVYEKISAIHSYITKNVDYDMTLSKYSAYDALGTGTVVCQGYALLMYKMLMDAGVPVRIISGDADNGRVTGPHAWNIVKIGKCWYNIDATWNDTSGSVRYFLKSGDGFPSHFRDSRYNTAAFNAAHPMSPRDFDPSQDVKPVRSITLSPEKASGYAVGDVFMLSAAVSPADATDKTLSWTTSDPGVAAVDGTGRVTVTGPGTAVITAEADDGSGITAAFTLDTPSAWAAENVSALNARGVVPPELKSRYRDDITRAEFMALIANVLSSETAPGNTSGGLLFTDIAVSPYRDQIAQCHQLGIIDGKGDNRFAPDDTLTRQECAKIVSNVVKAINGGDIVSNTAMPYADELSIAGWALPYVRYSYETGLMQGANGRFNPQGVLSREQAMTVLGRIMDKYGW